jgi:hypothetical protein
LQWALLFDKVCSKLQTSQGIVNKLLLKILKRQEMVSYVSTDCNVPKDVQHMLCQQVEEKQVQLPEGSNQEWLGTWYLEHSARGTTRDSKGWLVTALVATPSEKQEEPA